MLWQRVLTAMILIPPAVAAILFLSAVQLAPVFAAIGLIGATEWATLAGIPKGRKQALYAAGMVLPMAPIALCKLQGFPQIILLAVAMLWWLLALRWILIYPRGFSANSPSVAFRAVLGFLVVPSAISGLIAVRSSSLQVGGLLTLFLLVWSADIGAYFAGRAFGRHKLAPGVSPGKTWEGFAGGMLSVLVVAYAIWRRLQPSVSLGLWLCLCTLVAAISVVGDLTESLLKRQVGLKDSGKLLPGHGGVLDRIDSLLAAAPAMALGLRLLSL
jgi:phosphatidate cytidylyltransferase